MNYVLPFKQLSPCLYGLVKPDGAILFEDRPSPVFFCGGRGCVSGPAKVVVYNREMKSRDWSIGIFMQTLTGYWLVSDAMWLLLPPFQIPLDCCRCVSGL